MATELGKAYVQIIPSAQGISGSISSVLGGEAESAGKKAGLNIAGGIGSALKGAAGIMAAGTTAISGALVKGASDVASYGDNIDKMSQKMGLSAQSYQEWDAVMQHSGTSMEAMKASMKTLANAAQSGSQAFDALGISQEQIASMSQEQLFEATISALQNVENETERTYLAGKTLGRGATELGALLNTSAEDTQAMRDRVRELGGVMSDDAVKASAQFQDNLQDMKTAMSGVTRGIMTELLPGFNEIMAGFTSLIIGEEGATEKLSSGFESLFSSLDTIGTNIVSKITEMMPTIISGIATVLPQIIQMASTLIISFAQALVTEMPTLITTVVPALAVAAVELVVALGKALIETAPLLWDAGVQLIEMLKSSFDGANLMEQGSSMIQNVLDGITEKLPGLLEKGVDIITNIANGILENLPQLITTAGELITQFATFLMQNYPTIMQKGAELLLNLVNGIINNLPQIVSAVVQVIASFAATILQNLPTILAQGITIIGKLVAGLIQAIPQVVAAIPQIIQSIVNTFGNYDWLSIGRNIIQGIADGIRNAASLIIDAAKSAAQSAFEAAKSALGIQSPSKLFRDEVGAQISAGIALGITDGSDMVDKALQDLSTNAAATIDAGSMETVNGASTNDKIDVLIAMLANYLPEIAENKGVDVQTLYNGINRQLGWAIS